MKSKSTAVLNEASVEVLSRMSDEAAKVDRSKIDQMARARELEQIKKEKAVCKEVLARAESVHA